MSESAVSGSNLWQERLRRLRAGVKRAMPFISGMIAALGALLIYNLLFPGPPPLTTRDVNDTVAQALASATPPPAFSARVFQVIQPSLVVVQTRSPGEDGEEDNGLGSGVVITDRGEILTSLHVVSDATEILLTFADGTQSAAQVAVEQPENDIAVLQPEQLPALLVPATLGNPNAMRIGDEAFAVGNPFGLYDSMSAGVISGFNRSFQPTDGGQKLEGLIQVDAAVNPGNSGGPLLNRYGQVIGIVTGIVNPAKENFFVGVGFAVPITIAVGGIGAPPY
jgi:S1-C subfamily serine protease